MVDVIIATRIVGFDAYDNIGLVIGGTLGCDFISFVIIAIISITISIFNSGKLSSTLSILVICFSSLISIIISSIGSIVEETQLQKLGNKVVNVLNKKIKKT